MDEKQRSPASRETAIFLHIPKTAGSTLTSIIKRQYSANEIWDFGRIPPQQIAESLHKFKDAQGKDAIKIVTGHIPFGVHRFIPGPSSYLTILRHPVDRLISFYRFILSEPLHYRHNDLVSRKVTLEQFIEEQEQNGLSNLQIQYLIAGDLRPELWTNLTGPLEALPNNAMEMAKSNLSHHFSLAGTSERFDESLLLVCDILGWKNPAYLKENVGKFSKQKKPSPKPEIVRLIEKYSYADMELYTYVDERLSEILAQKGEIFQQRVSEFQLHNQSYLPLKKLAKNITKAINKIHFRKK